MKPISRILFMLTLALLVWGLPKAGYAEVVVVGQYDTSDELMDGFVFDCFPSNRNEPRKYRIAVADLLPIADSPDRLSAVIPEQLRDNFSLSGFFEPLDKRTFLEKTPEAGVVVGSHPEYPAWTQIGADFLIKGQIETSPSKLTLELRLFDVVLGKQMIGKRYVGRPDEARKLASRFTNDVLEAVIGTPGVFGSEIIFVSGSPDRKQIYKTALGSDEVVAITNDKANRPNTHPTVGPGGSVAWVRRIENTKNWELVSDDQVVYSGDLHLSPTFKPDGSLVAALSGPQKTAIFDFSVNPPKEPLNK